MHRREHYVRDDYGNAEGSKSRSFSHYVSEYDATGIKADIIANDVALFRSNSDSTAC
jgi:hypothetical protein